MMNGKQLKNSILQWAIQGKLVPQDPNDEPASVLLEKIRAEKARLVKEGKIKKDKKESIIYRGEDNSYYEKFADGKMICIDDEIPFEIPQGWEWCRFSSIYWQLTDGTHSTPKYTLSGIPFLSVKDMSTGRLSFSNTKFISEKEHKLLSQRCHPRKGDLLLSKVGTTGIPLIIDDDREFSIFVSLALIKFFSKFIDSSFLITLLNSPLVQMQVKENTRGVGNKNWVLTAISNTLLVIPPLHEQQRIVEKIGFLNPYIVRYARSESKLSHLNKEIGSNLKNSILHEAIQGKLVPQNPNDEPASVLLQRIKVEKQRLVKEGKLKKKDVVDSIIYKGDDNKYYEQVGKSITEITEEIPFSIPDSWTWSRLSGIAKIIMGQSPDGNDVFEAEKEDNAYEFHQGKIYFTEKYISPSDKWCKNPPRIANIGSLLVCVRAPIGDVNIVQRQIGIGRGLAAIIGYAKIKTDFLYYWMLAHKKNLIGKGTGSTFKAITLDVLKDLIIPIPPLAEQKRISSRIELLYDKIEDN